MYRSCNSSISNPIPNPLYLENSGEFGTIRNQCRPTNPANQQETR